MTTLATAPTATTNSIRSSTTDTDNLSNAETTMLEEPTTMTTVSTSSH